MRKDIHPEYTQAQIKCACGNEFAVGSTLKSLTIEICNECHPFYTGKQKVVDTAGRVEKFKKRMEMAAPKKEKKTRTKKEDKKD